MIKIEVKPRYVLSKRNMRTKWPISDTAIAMLVCDRFRYLAVYIIMGTLLFLMWLAAYALRKQEEVFEIKK